MTTQYSFSKFIYFDTNILSHLAKHPELWSKLFRFCSDKDLTIGLGEAQLVELVDADRIHQSLTDLLLNIPSALLTPADQLLTLEIQAHPATIQSKALLFFPINQLAVDSNGRQQLLDGFKSKELVAARETNKSHAKLMAKILNERKNNFPPSSNGLYTRRQAKLFSDSLAIQWLGKSNINFLNQFQNNNISKLNFDTFRSITLFGYVLFYKYYLGQRQPTNLSDFGDLGHFAYIPYCEIVVTERDVCNILNQIKHHHKVLEDTHIYNIEFFQEW